MRLWNGMPGVTPTDEMEVNGRDGVIIGVGDVKVRSLRSVPV